VFREDHRHWEITFSPTQSAWCCIEGNFRVAHKNEAAGAADATVLAFE